MNFNVRQRKVINAEEPKILCLSSAASGKALPDTSVIPTPAGAKKVGEIQIGDYLFDAKGNPTKVLGVYPQGELEVYELTFNNGCKARSSIDHIWYVHRNDWQEDRYEEMTLEQILNEGIFANDDGKLKWSIPTAPAVKYPKKEYSVSPYVIGAFLSSGRNTSEQLTFCTEDGDILNKIKSLIGVDEFYRYRFDSRDWYFKKNDNYMKSGILPKELRKGDYNKEIPAEYKYGSIEQRIELIQGLMDAGGVIEAIKDEGTFMFSPVFSSTSLKLIQDVKEILGSLGWTSIILVNKENSNVIYNLIIHVPNKDAEKLFSIPWKKEAFLSLIDDINSQLTYEKIFIKNIKKLDYKENMTCFYVDNPKHLFLTENFIITHNTRVLTERVRVLIEEKGVPADKIVAITFTNLAADEMKKRLGSIANDMYIGTIHAYAAKICYQNNIDVQEYINEELFDKILEKALLIRQDKYPKVSHLLIDECQDLNDLNYKFIYKIPTDNIFFVGDDRQMIYAFRGASKKELLNIYRDVSYKKYNLTDNYRNSPSIIEFANSLIASSRPLSPNSTPIKKKAGIVMECPFNDAIAELEDSGNWGSWFILGRTNAQIQEAQRILDEKEIPNISFKKGDFNSDELASLMATDKVKILTIHTAKGLENKNVIVTGAKLYNEEERNIAYVAATRAENALYWCPAISQQKKRINKKENMFTQKSSKVIEF